VVLTSWNDAIKGTEPGFSAASFVRPFELHSCQRRGYPKMKQGIGERTKRRGPKSQDEITLHTPNAAGDELAPAQSAIMRLWDASRAMLGLGRMAQGIAAAQGLPDDDRCSLGAQRMGRRQGVCMATDFWFTYYLKHNRRERGAKWVFVRKAGSRRTSSEFKPAAIVLNLVDYHYA
jgi:hypothetical protein